MGKGRPESDLPSGPVPEGEWFGNYRPRSRQTPFPPAQGRGRTDSHIYQSADNGQTWSYFAEIGDGKQQLNETALLRLSSGKFLAAIRSRAGDVWLSESLDGARTWSQPKLLTPPAIHPADLIELEDGRALLVMGNRAGP